MRTIAAATLACVLALNVALADNVYGSDDVIVALLDTGVRASHQEFDFGGPADDTDQFVGWWDFTNTLMAPFQPEPGQAWDPRNQIPYDDNGHGTGTAALAVGRNAVAPEIKAPSFAPGFKLAVAKVCTADGSCGADLSAAIRWATDTIGADVISISIGANVPTGDLLSTVHEAAGYARAAGVLTVVANGNGVARAGVPAPGWATASAGSTNVLSVGASDPAFQVLSTYDPEVVARFWDVPLASHVCDGCYTRNTGTSFAAPLVAGMAARAIGEALAHGMDPTPDQLETLLKYSARDTETPPIIEGYGVLDAEQLPLVLAHAAAGTLPSRPDPDPDALYVDTVAATLRDLVSNRLDGGARGFVPTGIGATTGPGALGNSNFAGYVEGETYRLTTAPGDQVRLNLMVGPDDTPAGFRIRVFDSADDILLLSEQVARSTWSSDINPVTVSFRSPVGGDYTVLVHGVLGFDFIADPFVLETQGTAGTLTFQGEDTYLTNVTVTD